MEKEVWIHNIKNRNRRFYIRGIFVSKIDKISDFIGVVDLVVDCVSSTNPRVI